MEHKIFLNVKIRFLSIFGDPKAKIEDSKHSQASMVQKSIWKGDTFGETVVETTLYPQV